MSYQYDYIISEKLYLYNIYSPDNTLMHLLQIFSNPRNYAQMNSFIINKNVPSLVCFINLSIFNTVNMNTNEIKRIIKDVKTPLSISQ